MGLLFNDRIGDNGPTAYLEQAGYTLTRDWQWEPKPGVVSYDDMTQDEFNCMLFLRDEWGYGMLSTL